MYELFLVACVGAKICQYLTAPIVYPTESRCRIAAALLAGQLRGTRSPGRKLEYRHECRYQFSIAEFDGINPAESPARPVR